MTPLVAVSTMLIGVGLFLLFGQLAESYFKRRNERRTLPYRQFTWNVNQVDYESRAWLMWHMRLSNGEDPGPRPIPRLGLPQESKRGHASVKVQVHGEEIEIWH